MSTTTAPTALICTSSTAGEPVWWVRCSCGWNHPEHRTQGTPPGCSASGASTADHPGTAIVEPTPATLTPYKVCPYCDATDETCPRGPRPSAPAASAHPGIEH